MLPRCYGDARQPVVQGRSFGVPYYPDALDPVARDVARQHRHGDAIKLGHQTGLTVDRTLQDRQVGCPAGELDEGARDLFAAFYWAELGADEAAAGGQAAGEITRRASRRARIATAR